MSAVLDIHEQSIETRPRKIKRPAESFGPLKKKHPYYDYGQLLSHNAPYNFLVGGRGLGKTYGAKKRAITRFIKHGDMWIYLRRYQEELKPVRETIFADISHEFENEWDFQVSGSELQISPASDRDSRKRTWRTMGYLIALSVAQKYKSVAYPLVKTIIFDEFIIEKGVVHYIQDEATVFNNFYSTVDRWQDKTTVFFLANAVSLSNPYFINYNIFPEEDTEWLKIKEGFIVCHFPKSLEFQESVSKTRFGRFIKDTDYEQYAVGNVFQDGGAALVGIKNPRARYQFTLETRLGLLSIWHDRLADEWYATQKRPGNELIFTLVIEKMAENKTLLPYTHNLMTDLRSAFSHGKIIFDRPATRNMFMDVFRQK